MVIAKCIYLPVTYNTKEGYIVMAERKKKKKRLTIFFSSFAIVCYLPLSVFQCILSSRV